MPKKTSAITLDSLRAKTDPRVVTRNKVLKQLDALKARKASYQFEQDFIKEAAIAQTHLRLIRTEFAKHIVLVTEVGKKSSRNAWFPNPADAAIIRREQEAIRKALSGGTQQED